MDNIQFVIEQEYELKTVAFKSYDIAVYLNNVKMPHSHFNVAEVLPMVKYKNVEFNLFTCSCGEPGCAGFQHKINSIIQDGIVTWNFPKNNDYKTDKKIYEFDENQFKNAFKKLSSKMFALEKQNIIHTTLIRDLSDYIEDDKNEVMYEIREKLKQSLQWYDNVYKKEEALQSLLNNKYPQYAHASLQYTYENKVSQYQYKLSEIIHRVINSYAGSKDKNYLQKVEKGAMAVIAFMNGNKESFKDIAYNSYEKNNMHSNSVISWDFPEVKEENFSFEHLELNIVHE